MEQTNIRRREKIQQRNSFAIAVPCFNEEQNIGELLNLLCSGWEEEYTPSKIAVFSSECRDRTEEIVRDFATKSKIPVILKNESKRSGKCHAINQLIEMVGDVDIIVLVSGDIQISGTNLTKMLKKFAQKDIGVVAGRPVPVCDRMNLAYRVSKVMWDIHHLMVLQAPKSTEVTAFKNIGFRLDEKSLVDEAEIEQNISRSGLAIQYCPDATISNKAPETIIDYIKQRTRVMLGHNILKKKKKYSVGSMRAGVRTHALIKYMASKETDYLAFFTLLVVEVWISLAAYFMGHVKSDTGGKWDRIESAKRKFT